MTGVSAALAPFSLVGGTCGSTPTFDIPPDGSCTLDYLFAPAAIGPAAQTIVITSDAPAGTDNVFVIQGNGTAPPPQAIPTLNGWGIALLALVLAGLALRRRSVTG